VICIDFIILSNKGFHDQYAPNQSEFAHNWTSKDYNRITDTKGNEYIKITMDTEYWIDIEKMIVNIVLANRIYKDVKGNILKQSEEGFLT
jgi:hypothetical protein